MRDYQLAGLNWLIRLYENGINGILADEMVCLVLTLPFVLTLSLYSAYKANMVILKHFRALIFGIPHLLI
jgi:hypothetical protein